MPLQIHPYAVRVARGDLHGLAFFVLHLRQFDLAITAGVDDFERIAQRKLVFGFHQGPAIFAHGADFAHKLAALVERMACFVVLVILRWAAL